MKKIFLAMIMGSLLCLSACSREKEKTLSICTESEYEKVVDTLISFYNKIYPKVEFNVLTLPSDVEEREATLKKIQTQTMAGEGPDVFLLPAQYEEDNSEGKKPLFSNMNKVISSDVFLDLNPYLEKDDSFQKENYQEAVLQSGVYEGKQYVLPLFYQLPILYLEESEASVNHLEEKASFWKLDELQNFMAGHDNASVQYIGCAWNRITTNDYLASCIDYKNRALRLSEEEILEILNSEQKFLLDYPVYGESLKKNIKHYADNVILLENAVNGEYPKEAEAYEKEFFLLEKNKEEKVLGQVTVYAAVSRSCAFPEEAVQYIKLFLDPGFQAGNELTIEAKENLGGVYDEAIHKNIPVCKNAWTGWLQQKSGSNVPKEALDTLKTALDSMDGAILYSEVNRYTDSLLKPLYEGDEVNLEETAQSLYEFYDKTAKE